MIRVEAVFFLAGSLAALTACASPPPRIAANSPQVIEASQVYQSLRVQEVEQHMRYDDSLITYANAAVACGLRSQQWFDLLRAVYAKDYAEEMRKVPLNAVQQAEVSADAATHIQSPSPPPYICERIGQDSVLASLDYSIAVKSEEIVASAR